MNPGELHERFSVLSINKSGNVYTWSVDATAWAKVEVTTKNNLFSRVGIGAKSVNFVIRKRSLTLHNAFYWNGKHCFLTDIIENEDRMYYEVTAALIEPRNCTVERTNKPTLDNFNRPIYTEPTIISFPACLTEKYIRQTQEQPMSTIESRYVLVTPKTITLSDGELVTIDNIAYEVLVTHSLDEYKNEYEISVRRNA